MAITVRYCSVEKYMRTLLSDDFDRTDIGFKPMILTLGHDFYLLILLFKRCPMSSHFGQCHTANVDQALFSRCIELEWSVPEC